MDKLKRWLEDSPERTQAALARDMGVSAPTVNEWVHGESSPSSQRLHRMHEITGISVTELIEDCATDGARRKAARATAAA